MNEIISKIFAWLKTSPKWTKAVFPFLVASAVVVFFLSSCGSTRTIVRTQGKGTTEAHISVTTNNPTHVSVETLLDSTKLMINKQNSK